MKNISDKYIVIWLKISLIIITLIIVVGGITRLTQSGLSIPYWKPITGILPPASSIQWEHEFDEYKKYPEYNKLNFNMTLTQYKQIYYWEYFHRMLGRLIGFLFFIPFVIFYLKNFLSNRLIKKLLFLFFLGVLQGFMGWFMVKSGLVDNPHVSHYRLSLHLLLAFIIIGGIHKIELSLKYFTKAKISQYEYFNKFINIIVFLFFLQIIYGAFTAGLEAGKVWNTFPLIDGKIIPDDLLIKKPLYLNFIEHDKTIQFIHRYIGLLLMFLIYAFSFRIKNVNFILNKKSTNLVVLVTCQVFLGILTLVSNVPIVLACSHQLLAIFLLLQIISTKHFLRYR